MKKLSTTLLLSFLITLTVYGQKVSDVTGALNTASSQVKTLFTAVSNFLWIVSGLIAIVGAIKIFTKFQNQDQDTSKSIAMWVGGLVSLVIFNLIIKAIFIN